MQDEDLIGMLDLITPCVIIEPSRAEIHLRPMNCLRGGGGPGQVGEGPARFLAHLPS